MKGSVEEVWAEGATWAWGALGLHPAGPVGDSCVRTHRSAVASGRCLQSSQLRWEPRACRFRPRGWAGGSSEAAFILETLGLWNLR